MITVEKLPLKHGYVAKLGNWEETGLTKKEAKERLEAAIKWFSEQEFDKSIQNLIYSDKNTVILGLFEMDFGGYFYRIVELTSEMNFKEERAFTRLGRVDFKQAFTQFITFVNQYKSALKEEDVYA